MAKKLRKSRLDLDLSVEKSRSSRQYIEHTFEKTNLSK